VGAVEPRQQGLRQVVGEVEPVNVSRDFDRTWVKLNHVSRDVGKTWVKLNR